MAGPHFNPAVIAARELLEAGQGKLRTRHENGSPGIQVCAGLTDLLDDILLELYRAALERTNPEVESLVTLVAHGGYGRRDVAPFSDVDLMLLYPPEADSAISNFVRELTHSIYDTGLDLGFSYRTASQARALAWKDATVFSSLAESRYLAGNQDLFTRFQLKFRSQAMRRSASLIAQIDDARREERNQYGETIYLLEPNIKRSRGCLRDLQKLRWIGFARYGEAEPTMLEQSGLLPTEDRRKLQKAREFLLRLRNDLHFHANKSQDILNKQEQLRLAERYNYQGSESVLPVESFMRAFFEHTREVEYIVAHFLASAKSRGGIGAVVGQLFTHRVVGDFRAGPVHIGATKKSMPKLKSDLAEILRLMDLANRYNNRIDHRTWQTIRDAMIQQPDMEVSDLAVKRFLSLVSQPGRLANQLRRLHELRVLEKLIPAMSHARGLMQFNNYHKYTVDEHSIRAVERATQFLDDQGPLGEAYRGLRDKRLLHLALLLHDLGKGYEEDHSEVGLRIARETTKRFGLKPSEVETVCFLVHKHLLMSHLAQRRDINDRDVVVRFAVEVGSPEVLQMLYVLTCADLAAVGPGVLNRWKKALITQLYLRARDHLASDSASPQDERLTERTHTLRKLAAGFEDQDWWGRQIKALPTNYLATADPDEFIEHLERVRKLSRDRAIAWGRYNPAQRAMEYSIAAHDSIAPGIFHRLTGVLTSSGMQILAGEIHTLSDGIILDQFYVQDLDYAGESPAIRKEEVTAKLMKALEEPTDEPPSFRRTWSDSTADTAEFDAVPAQIRFDNNTSDRFTIIDIFAHDRIGLLYSISRALFDAGLKVQVAKIGTHLDQVVDVFYVTDQKEEKITDESSLEFIRVQLLNAIASPTPATS